MDQKSMDFTLLLKKNKPEFKINGLTSLIFQISEKVKNA